MLKESEKVERVVAEFSTIEKEIRKHQDKLRKKDPTNPQLDMVITHLWGISYSDEFARWHQGQPAYDALQQYIKEIKGLI